jgi:hypothetical protein
MADGLEEFQGQRATMLVSYNDVLPATDDFTFGWSRYKAKKKASILVELEDSLS